jgi:membrane-associated phospholipid phosphatase
VKCTVDEWISAKAAELRGPASVSLSRAITMLGETPVAYPILAVDLLARRASLRPLVIAGLALAVRRVVAEAVARPRPPRPRWAAPAGGPSFPSRHTASATLVAHLLADSAVRHRAPARLLAHGVSGAVAASRIWLGVHWPSDVLGGWLYARFWLSVIRRTSTPRQ